jgi:hypothetical protein
MKTITKHFDTMKQAERFLNKLYSQFDFVNLISYPVFSESGIYTFQIK